MRIKKKKHYCSGYREAIDILNSQYSSLHVRSLDWYNQNKDSYGTVPVPYLFVIGMSPYTGEEFENFKAVYRRNYIRIEPENSYGYSWSLEMFEEFDDFIIDLGDENT